MSKRNVVCYHHNDLDGKSAGWIVYQNNKIYSTADNYHSTTYEDPFNKHTANDDVYIVDISISDKTYKMFIDAIKNAKSVTWIDHHKTSVDIIEAHKDELDSLKNLTYFVSENGCGALLTYVWFESMAESINGHKVFLRPGEYIVPFANKPVKDKVSFGIDKFAKDGSKINAYSNFINIPSWLMYVDDYDRWQKQHTATDDFTCATDSYDTAVTKWNPDSKLRVFNTSFWEKVMTVDNVPYLIKEGTIINRYITSKYIKENVDMFEWEYEGTKFLCKNGSGNSWNFGSLFEKYDACILFRYTGRSGLWLHSVYSDEKSKFNCERFCKKFGGGGHVHASGFSVDKPVMFEMGTVQPIQKKD